MYKLFPNEILISGRGTHAASGTKLPLDKNEESHLQLISNFVSMNRFDGMIAPIHSKHMIESRKQRTLAREVTFSGIGIHTGEVVTMRFCPAKDGAGIFFKRTDLSGHPVIPATLEYVCDTSKNNTSLGVGNVRVHTVEHVLAALAAYQIDNLCIELNNIEPPVGNGSSDVFVEMIENSGVDEHEGRVPIVKLHQPIYWSEGDIHIAAIPHDGLRISYTLHYPKAGLLKAQFHSLQVNARSFKEEIAPCRTFTLYEEVTWLMDRGLIKGGSLDNAVIIQDNVAFSKNGLFFSNEMVRHKILDMIGDLSLVGFDFHAHVIAIRAGHASNNAFAKILYQTITKENS